MFPSSILCSHNVRGNKEKYSKELSLFSAFLQEFYHRLEKQLYNGNKRALELVSLLCTVRVKY